MTLLLPPPNVAEASLVSRLALAAPPTLGALVTQLRAGRLAPAVPGDNGSAAAAAAEAVDLADVIGQEIAKRAIEIAAAGAHALLMIGPPGAGKTMLARRLPTILPALSEEEALEVVAIHSVPDIFVNQSERGGPPSADGAGLAPVRADCFFIPMSRKPNKRQRANNRRQQARSLATALPAGIEREPRMPLAGFESLYEITRSGHVYSRREGRFIKHAFLRGSYIKLQVDGESHTLAIADAIAASWGEGAGQLFVVEVPATTLVVYARDLREANEATIVGVSEEIANGTTAIRITLLSDEAQVPNGWGDAMPFRAPAFGPDDATVVDVFRRRRPDRRDG